MSPIGHDMSVCVTQILPFFYSIQPLNFQVPLDREGFYIRKCIRHRYIFML